MTRKFFQIGFNKCGTTFIAKLFDINHIPAVHWLEGALAEDIAYSKLANRAPLRKWSADTVAFTDMESVRYLNLPIIEAFKEYAFLDKHFPGAVFLLNTRRVEDWIKSRYMHRGGDYARACAQIRGVALADLGDIWRADWDAHLAGCRAYFAGRPEFVEIDIDHATPGDYRDALAPWFDLRKCPDMPDKSRMTYRASYTESQARMLAEAKPPASAPNPEATGIAEALAIFANPAHHRIGTEPAEGTPEKLVRFDVSRQELTDATGKPLPIRRDGSGWYLCDPAHLQHLPAAAFANDIAQVTDHGVYEFNPRDTRLIGGNAAQQTDRPILASSRREGDGNIFLWPMVRQHRLGHTVFLGTPPDDMLSFDEKQDRAIWRGTLSGYAFDAQGPDLSRPAEHAMSALLNTPADKPGHKKALRELRQNSRVRFLRRHIRKPDLDACFLPQPQSARALAAADLENYIATAKDPGNFLRQHRYIVCLSGDAGAEDFLPLVNTRSVVLKETDGWELFWSGLFRPWEHFIPLEWGADDLGARLRWARANPDACRVTSENARKLCAHLANPLVRRLHLQGVLRAYRKATGQTV